MHRTVKNQQGELPFPKCQAYNLQNDGVAKKKKKEERKIEKRRKQERKMSVKEESMVKNMIKNSKES